MNLLFFANSLSGGGAEKSLITIADALAHRGHHVVIAADLSSPAYELPTSVQFIEKNTFELKEAGTWLLLHRKIFNRIRLLIATKKIISSTSPDVIITFLHANMWEIIQVHGRIPIISSERNTFDRKLYKHEYKEKYFLNRHFDRVTVLTNYDKEFIGDRLHNVVVMPNALSSPILKIDEYANSFSARKNILACGRMSAIGEDGKLVKGFDLLIEAFSLIANKHPECDLDIAGDGSNAGLLYLKEIAERNGIGDRVHFLGFIKDIDELMKKHSLFVLSSRVEGFGRVVIESYAAGTPVVAFNCSGPSEIIINGIDGYLVEKENIAHLANRMSMVLEDKELRFTLGKNALKNVKRFSMDRIVQKWEDLFFQVLNERGKC